MRTKYNVKYAYTLKDIMSYAISSVYEVSSDYLPYDGLNSATITRTIFTYFSLSVDSSSVISENYLDKDRTCLLQMIFNRYWDEYVLEDEHEVNPVTNFSPASLLYKIKRFCGKLWDLVRMTYPKYSVLLKAYSDEAANLTAKLEKILDGSATTRNNDTPQDGGDFADDSYTSYITQGKVDNTESWDNESMIERLDKINRLYHKVMEEWLNEFKDLFVEGGNYL